MGVAEAQCRIGSAEFSEWLAYYTIEPFGERADWHRFGSLMCLLGGMFTGQKQKKPDIKDFIPRDPLEPPQTQQEMKQNLLTWAKGVIRRQKRTGGS